MIMPVHERALTNSLPLVPAPETPNVNYAPVRAEQLSDDANWGDLKDLLHRLYIQESKVTGESDFPNGNSRTLNI